LSKEKSNSFGRLFSGRHGKYSDLKRGELKSEGSEIGAFFSCSKTNPAKKDEKITFLGKFIKNPVEEKIYMDIVRYFSNAPSTRLVCLKEEIIKECSMNSKIFSYCRNDNEMFEKEVWQSGLKDQFPNVKEGEYLAYLSKLVPGYRNLEDYQVKDKNQNNIKFTDYIEKYKTFPLRVTIDDNEYPLTGIMKNAAVALFIGDQDWLGGSCKNTGAYIENVNDTDCAVAITIDAGFSANSDVTPFEISENVIPYNANYSAKDKNQNSIHIDKLPEELRNEFFQSLYLIVHRYPGGDKRMDYLLEKIVKRNGAFNDPSFDRKILTDDKAIKIVDKLKNRINKLRVMFSAELQEYAFKNKEFLNKLVLQERKKDLEFLQHIQESSKERTLVIIQPDENSVNPIKSGKSTWSDLFNSINWEKFGILVIGTAIVAASAWALGRSKS
jgi:hypothetical protein